ncbi:MAG: hypothetical protein ACFE95_23645 [Candidatus Hodarchaeota archaeon]
MPFTPFHWGASVLFQALIIILDPVALFVSSIAPDIEGITALFIFPRLGLPLHGILHSFFGATILGLITGISSWASFKHFIPKILEITSTNLNLPQYSLKISLLSAFIGTYSHIILDSPLYREMELFFPLKLGNPWYNIVPGNFVYFFCVFSFFLGISIFILRINFMNSKKLVD